MLLLLLCVITFALTVLFAVGFVVLIFTQRAANVRMNAMANENAKARAFYDYAQTLIAQMKELRNAAIEIDKIPNLPIYNGIDVINMQRSTFDRLHVAIENSKPHGPLPVQPVKRSRTGQSVKE